MLTEKMKKNEGCGQKCANNNNIRE